MSGLGEREGRPNSYASPMTACGHGLWRTGLLPVRRTAATGHGGTACLDEGADRLPHIMKIHPASLPYHTGVDHPSSVKVLRSGLKPQRARPQHTDTRPTATRLPHGHAHGPRGARWRRWTGCCLERDAPKVRDLRGRCVCELKAQLRSPFRFPNNRKASTLLPHDG